MPSEHLIFKDNDNFFTLSELRNASQSANSFLPSNTSVMFTLQTTNGTAVVGMTFPAAATYDSVIGRGTFEGTLESGLSIELYKHYDLIIDVLGSGIPVGKIELRHFCAPKGKFDGATL